MTVKATRVRINGMCIVANKELKLIATLTIVIHVAKVDLGKSGLFTIKLFSIFNNHVDCGHILESARICRDKMNKKFRTIRKQCLSSAVYARH